MSNDQEILSLLKSIDSRLHYLEHSRFDFCNMLIQPSNSKYTSRKEVNLLCEYNFPHSGKKASFIPVIASNMDTVGTFSMCKVLSKKQMFTTLHKHYTKEEMDNFCASLSDEDFEYFAISTGIGSADYEKTNAILADNPRIQYICVDVANGYMLRLNDFLAELRTRYPDKTIFVGNVVSGDRTKELLQWADVVKVGIGPGSVCTTRQETGVGRSQAISVIDCSKAAKEVGGYIISDGGCNNVGNIAHAFVCGADMVMLGGMFSGTDEAEAEILTDRNGKKWLNFHGMSSEEAMEKHYKDFRERMSYRSGEGRSIFVAYKGPAETIANQILGGLRSTVTYTGVDGLLQLRTAKYEILSSFNNGINENLAALSNPAW